MDLLPVLLLLLLSGLLSGTEAAVFSLTTSQREALRRLTANDIDYVRGRRILGWLRNPEKTLAGILLGNLTVNIILTETGHATLAKITGRENIFLLSLITITVTILIFGEVMPKILALKTARSWAFTVSGGFSVWFRITSVIAWPVFKLTSFIVSFLPPKKVLSESELLQAVEIADSSGILSRPELLLLRRSVYFHHSLVYDLLIPRSRLFQLSENTTPSAARRLFRKTGHQFALIFDQETSEIRGYIQIRNLLLSLYHKQKNIRRIVQPILHLPETMSLQAAVESFIKNRTEIAAVVAETGEISGVVTLKKILGKLMGEQDDPSELKTKIRTLEENLYLIDGSITLSEFNEFFGSALSSEGVETLAGYILEVLDGFPDEKTVLHEENFEFSDMEISDYMIRKLRMRVAEKTDD